MLSGIFEIMEDVDTQAREESAIATTALLDVAQKHGYVTVSEQFKSLYEVFKYVDANHKEELEKHAKILKTFTEVIKKNKKK